MPPRATRPKSIFFGPHHRFFNFPFPGRILLQLHNLQPGEFVQPLHLILAHRPRVLLPFTFAPFWFQLDTTFQFVFRQSFLATDLIAVYLPLGTQFFNLPIHLGVNTFAYNTITAPAGRFAFGGTVTLTWTDL